MASDSIAPSAGPEVTPVEELLVRLAEVLLGNFFFDPRNEQVYKRLLSEHRASGSHGALLDEDIIELPEGECELRIEALHGLMRFRSALAYEELSATVEGTWSFDNESLGSVRVTTIGDPERIQWVAEAVIRALAGAGLDEGEWSD